MLPSVDESSFSHVPVIISNPKLFSRALLTASDKETDNRNLDSLQNSSMDRK